MWLRTMSLSGIVVFLMGSLGNAVLGADDFGPPLPGTKLLTMTGDIASELVAGVNRFLLKQIDELTGKRAAYWKRDYSSAGAYQASVEPNRKRLAHILGVRDPRTATRRDLANPVILAKPSLGAQVVSLTWPAFGDVTGEGLLVVPKEPSVIDLNIIVIPDADQSPEQLLGIVPGVPPDSQVARRLAESGCAVSIPALIDRTVAPRNSRAKLTHREFIYRSAFELGRHVIGYEVQKVLALVDILSRPDAVTGSPRNTKIGVFGYGEGAAIALFAAALDTRIDAVCVSGYFDDRNDIWQQPVNRNVFGLLEQFGDAEVASLIAPRPLIIEAARGPEFIIPTGTGGAPGRLVTPKFETVKAEVERARHLVAGLKPAPQIELIASGPNGNGSFGTEETLQKLLTALKPSAKLAARETQTLRFDPIPVGDSKTRLERQLHELDRHNQQLLVDSPDVRREFMKKLNTSSIEAYTKSVEPYRTFFADEVIGRFDFERLPPKVRSRRIYDEPKFTGYEVVMDVFSNVIAYGILLLPKGIEEGEKRPVVVCQHGLEGRPRDVADPKVDNPAYHRFAVRLAEEGLITFAPQNLYIFQDRFRTLQRKANPLKKTLFSVIVPQHQQITDWLKTLPVVEPGADCLLRAQLRGQVGNADSPLGQGLLSVDLFS